MFGRWGFEAFEGLLLSAVERGGSIRSWRSAAASSGVAKEMNRRHTNDGGDGEGETRWSECGVREEEEKKRKLRKVKTEAEGITED